MKLRLSLPAHRPPALKTSLAGTALLMLAALVPVQAQAQEAAARSLVISPTFSASETLLYTSRGTSGRNGSESITTLSPGMFLSSPSGRIRGSLSYSLNASYYAKDSNSSRLDNALAASFIVEAIENWAFVDTAASITQSQISPFGEQVAPDSPRNSANRTEVASYSVSPYVRGSLGGLANYEARYSFIGTETEASTAPDSTARVTSLALSSPSNGAMFGWGLTGVRQEVDFRTGRPTVTDRINTSLSMVPHPDVRLSVNGGREATDVGATERRSFDNWGFGARWTPTERTNISVQGDRRFFGDSHAVIFEHRMPRTVWRYTDSRDATTGTDINGVGQPITLFQLLMALGARNFPDPIERERVVREDLRRNRLNGNAVVGSSPLASAVTLQRRQDLSFAVNGIRDTLTLQAFRSDSRLLDNPNNVPDGGRIKLSGVVVSLAHRLTPTSSLTASALWQKTAATASRSGSDLTSASLGWQDEIGRHTTASVGGRFAVSNGSDPYRETSVTAAIGLRF
jgi:uncharacterized protein (PEP-CTERM system associated)